MGGIWPAPSELIVPGTASAGIAPNWHGSASGFRTRRSFIAPCRRFSSWSRGYGLSDDYDGPLLFGNVRGRRCPGDSNHSVGEYVRGQAHTNASPSVAAQAGLGTGHHMSEAFRWTFRFADAFRHTLAATLGGEAMRHDDVRVQCRKSLTACEQREEFVRCAPRTTTSIGKSPRISPEQAVVRTLVSRKTRSDPHRARRAHQSRPCRRSTSSLRGPYIASPNPSRPARIRDQGAPSSPISSVADPIGLWRGSMPLTSPKMLDRHMA